MTNAFYLVETIETFRTPYKNNFCSLIMLIYTNKSKLGSLNFFRICRDSITNSIIAEISWKKKHLFHWISKNFSYRFISGWLRLVLPVIAAATFWLRTIRWQTTERSNPMITSRHNTSIEMWSQNSIQMFAYSIKVFIYNLGIPLQVCKLLCVK